MPPDTHPGDSLPASFHLGLFVPGLRGGLDQAVEYLLNETNDDSAVTKVYATKGTSSRLAPLQFASTLAIVIKDRLSGRLDGAHLNLASKGSTVRKVIVAMLLVALHVPYVLQLHGGGYQAFWDRQGKLGRLFIQFLFNRARTVLVLGGPFTTLVVDEIGVDATKVVVVPNGTTTPSSVDRSARATTPNIIYLGRLHGPKGTYDLIEALGRMKDLDWTAFLAGHDEADLVRGAADAAGISDRVAVASWIEHEQVAAHLNRSSIFALPSYTEAMSISLLEAMSYGLACVTTPVGAHREVIRDKENGLLIQAGDVASLAAALRALVSEPELAQKIGDQAQLDFARLYDAKVVKQQIEKIYVQSFLGSTNSR